MTPPPGPPASDPLPTPLAPEASASRETRWDWRLKTRWFAAEIVVVVAGVLIALALNAWWGARQSAAKERVYLQQLATDLELTATRLEGAVESMTRTRDTSSRLLSAFSDPERADPDSIAKWSAQAVWYSRPSLSLGVARALVSTDLDVVRDDSIRTTIFGLLSHAEQHDAFDSETFSSFLDYSNQLRPFTPMAGRLVTFRDLGVLDSIALAQTFGALPVGADRQAAYPMDVEAFLQNREAYIVIDGLFDMAVDLRTFHTRFLQRVRQAQGVLARRGITPEAQVAP